MACNPCHSRPTARVSCPTRVSCISQSFHLSVSQAYGSGCPVQCWPLDITAHLNTPGIIYVHRHKYRPSAEVCIAMNGLRNVKQHLKSPAVQAARKPLCTSAGQPGPACAGCLGCRVGITCNSDTSLDTADVPVKFDMRCQVAARHPVDHKDNPRCICQMLAARHRLPAGLPRLRLQMTSPETTARWRLARLPAAAWCRAWLHA